MQARAIAQGAIKAHKASVKVSPEIMVPLVSIVEEFKILKN